jgi:teichuronic acid biosynthesis glycosyltransferase TuaC
MTATLATPSLHAPTLAQNSLAKLHVLTLTPFYPSCGDEISGCFVAESLQQVQSQGVTSSVIAVDSIYRSARKTSPQFAAEWLRYPQLPGNFGLSTAGNFLGAVLVNKVRQLHRRSPLHLIHAHAALPCGHAAMFLARSIGIPYVVTIHGLDVFNSCFQAGFAARWRRKSSQRVYANAAKVICISEKVRQSLTNADFHSASSQPVNTQPFKTEVVYNGTDTELFTPATAQTVAPNLLMVGNLLAGKGQELALQAIAAIKDSYPDLRCTIIGEGADRHRFVTLAKDLNISSRVDFLGRRGRREVAEAMRNCSIFVLPSRYEGLGCVYLEAMSCGKPVIACRGQGIDEIISHRINGWLIPVDGLKELIEGLQTLLPNPALRASIGQAARTTIVNDFTLTHQARHLARIYQEAAP